MPLDDPSQHDWCCGSDRAFVRWHRLVSPGVFERYVLHCISVRLLLRGRKYIRGGRLPLEDRLKQVSSPCVRA